MREIDALLKSIVQWLTIFFESIGVLTLIAVYWLFTAGFFAWLLKATP